MRFTVRQETSEIVVNAHRMVIDLDSIKISVRHRADMTALSNMFHTGTTVLNDGWAVTRFKETPRMSSHAVSICVGHFASLSAISESGVLVRAFSWTGMEIYADFSLK
ncbi:hypothetical protein ANCCAN_28667, partial [Ancylostoma caninum]